MPSLSSISAVWLRVDQSDLEPMITPTSALIVVPLLSGASLWRRVQNQQATRDDRRGLCAKKAAQYTVKPGLASSHYYRLSRVTRRKPKHCAETTPAVLIGTQCLSLLYIHRGSHHEPNHESRRRPYLWPAAAHRGGQGATARPWADPGKNRGLWCLPYRPACCRRRLAGETQPALYPRSRGRRLCRRGGFRRQARQRRRPDRRAVAVYL